MVSRLKILGPKCGPVLFQLPARFEANAERLASFLHRLPKEYSYAFEIRHESWYAKSLSTYWKPTTSASVFQITIRRLRLGPSPRRMSTCADMALEAGPRATIPTGPCASRHGASGACNATGSTLTSTLITTRRAPHRRMPISSSTCFSAGPSIGTACPRLRRWSPRRRSSRAGQRA
jgi:hypothetical protein